MRGVRECPRISCSVPEGVASAGLAECRWVVSGVGV